MQTRLAILVVLFCSPALAQFGGGRGASAPASRGSGSGRGGGSGWGGGSGFNPTFPVSLPPVPSPAVGAAWLGLNPLFGTLTPSYPPGVNAALFGLPRLSPGFFGSPAASVTPYYGGYFGGGLYGAPYYPPQPSSNLTVVLPPQPVIVAPPPVPVPELISDSEPPDTAAPPAAAFPPAPPREPVIQNEYPAIIAVRNGNLYSAYRYWTKGKTFHFITTNGEHHQIPLDMLESLYPSQRDGRPVQPGDPAGR